MKIIKSLVACAITTVFSGFVIAADDITIGETTVTPYARVVAGVEYVNNAYDAGEIGSRIQAESNQWGVSYFGVKSSTELTDGWAAIVNLESGFGTNTGELSYADTLFDRSANAGLKHDTYGTLTIGTHLAIAQDLEDVDPMGFQLYGLNSLVNGANEGSMEESVLYRSPSFGGFSVGYMHKFGAIVDHNDRSSGDGVSLSYADNSLTLRAVYQTQRDEFGRYSGGKYYGLGSSSQWIYVKTTAFAGTYDFGEVKLFAGYEMIEAPESGFNKTIEADTEAAVAWVGINYDITSKIKLLGAYYQSDLKDSGKKSDLFSLGVNYEWTQNVILHATMGHISNNDLDPALLSDVGHHNHALNYTETICSNEPSISGACNGESQSGAYVGIAIKL